MKKKKCVGFMGRDKPNKTLLVTVVTEFVEGALNTGEAFYHEIEARSRLIVTTWREITGLD